MYRSRNRNRQGGPNSIKGPSSALTQFLKEEGISAEAIRNRWLQRQVKGGDKKEGSPDEDKDTAFTTNNDEEVKKDYDSESTLSDEPRLKREALEANIVSDEEDEEDVEYKEITPAKDESVSYEERMKRFNQDSDEEEYDESASASIEPLVLPEKKVDKATIEKKARTVIQNRRKKQRRAANLLDRKSNAVLSLQALCIAKISQNIYKWQKDSEEKRNNDHNVMFSHLREVLGGVSTENLNNLANALSKNRALNDQTLQLFLKTDLEALTFHDCSKVSFDGYKTLAIFTPHIKKLSLHMCGQLNNESLLYIAEKLRNLTSLYLDGPFLINEKTWVQFFEIMKGRLEEFHVSNTHRFTDKSLASLLINCGSSLKALGLSRLDGLFNYALIPQYLCNEEFHSLDLGYPYNDEDITDEVVINILGQIGHSLKRLVLCGCSELSDSVIINGIGAFIGENNRLEEIGLEELDQISNDSLLYLFSQIQFPNLRVCSFRRSIQIGDDTIMELFQNAAVNTLEILNLNSLNSLTKESLLLLSCPHLKHLDVAFVRAVDDEVVGRLGKQNPKLSLMEVFGDPLVTEKAKIRPGITLTGRQSDSI